MERSQSLQESAMLGVEVDMAPNSTIVKQMNERGAIKEVPEEDGVDCEDEMRKLNESAVIVDKELWQKKSYCQICFTKFSVSLRQHHCRMCGRSCCYYCSGQRAVKDVEEAAQQALMQSDLGSSVLSGDWEQSFVENLEKGGKKEPMTRICEYCEVKLNNKQLEKFYELGKTW